MKENSFILIINLLVFLCLSYTFCKNALHMFQQQHYETYRYGKWLINRNNLHFSFAIIYCVLVIALNIIFKDVALSVIIIVLSILMSFLFIYKESKNDYIKPLVVTARVKRQIAVTIILLLIVEYVAIKYLPISFACIFAIYMPYLIIYPLAFITDPIENAIKKGYENEARKKLYSFDNLIKIGITGSYGKTSTKNIVNDIISNNYLTYITPASYNTPMGITRVIRGELKPIHEVFVCEMGADKVGDISYLMDFVKPKFGVVTSIGPQHLNTFKSIENIINEKMQEIELLPSDGVGFINLDNEYIANYKIKNNCKVVSVGINNDKADYVAKNIKYSKDGSSFTVLINKKKYKFNTCLLGQHNITNILIGIAIAIELNIDIRDIVNSVNNVRQVEHRLEIKHLNGFTFIDDAFNANPVGSKMSVDVLSLMPGKRVIVTPGMIDLGVKQDEINKQFGAYMINKVDFVILVGEKQTKAIYEGLKESGFNMNNVIVLRNVKDAFNYVYAKFSIRDTILLENDLPDAFNI